MTLCMVATCFQNKARLFPALRQRSGWGEGVCHPNVMKGIAFGGHCLLLMSGVCRMCRISVLNASRSGH